MKKSKIQNKIQYKIKDKIFGVQFETSDELIVCSGLISMSGKLKELFRYFHYR